MQIGKAWALNYLDWQGKRMLKKATGFLSSKITVFMTGPMFTIQRMMMQRG
jgi:hypothetical protein